MSRSKKRIMKTGGAVQVSKSTVVKEDQEPLLPTMFVRVIKAAKPVTSTPPSQQITNDDFSSYYEGEVVVQPYVDPSALLNLAQENPVHCACITAVAADATGRGWKLEWSGQPDLRIEQKDVKQAQQELWQKLEDITPNLTFSELLRQAVWELRAIGWAAWEVARDSSGEIGALYPIPAHTVRVLKDKTGYIQIRGGKARYFRNFGQEGALPEGVEFVNVDTGDASRANELLFFQSYHPRTPFYGLPDWVSAVSSMAEMTQIREFNMSFFSSGGMADRIITVKADNEAVADALGKKIEEQVQAAKGLAHVSIVISGTTDVEVRVESMSRTEGDRDGQFRTRRDDLVKEILMAHSVPPYRIGFAELGTLGGSAAREMLRAYRFGAIEPVQTIIEDRLTQTLFGQQGLQIPSSMRWVLQDVDFELVDLNLLIATRGVQNGFATPSQAGQLMGFEPTDDPAANRLYMDGVPITGDVREGQPSGLSTEQPSGLPEGMAPTAPTPMETPAPQSGGNGRGGTIEVASA